LRHEGRRKLCENGCFQVIGQNVPRVHRL
jgi:hypothetical protein